MVLKQWRDGSRSFFFTSVGQFLFSSGKGDVDVSGDCVFSTGSGGKASRTVTELFKDKKVQAVFRPLVDQLDHCFTLFLDGKFTEALELLNETRARASAEFSETPFQKFFEPAYLFTSADLEVFRSPLSHPPFDTDEALHDVLLFEILINVLHAIFAFYLDIRNVNEVFETLLETFRHLKAEEVTCLHAGIQLFSLELKQSTITRGKSIAGTSSRVETPHRSYHSRLLQLQGELQSCLSAFSLDQELNLLEKLQVFFAAILENVLGNLLWKNEQFKAALEHFQRCLSLHHHLQARSFLAKMYRNLAITYNQLGQTEQAIQSITTAASLFETLNDMGALVKTKNTQGLLLKQQQRWKEAAAIFQDALALCEQLQDPMCKQIMYNNLGNLYKDLGDLDQAQDYYSRSLALSKERGDSKRMALSLNNLGNIYLLEGDLDKAAQAYEDALTVAQQLTDSKLVSSLYTNLGYLYWTKGELEHAKTWLLKSLEYMDQHPSLVPKADTLFALILLALQIHDQEAATEYWQQLDALATTSDLPALDHRRDLARAIIYQNSRRLRDKAQAEEILKRLLQSPHLEFELRLVASLRYLELLLLEWKLDQDPATAREFRQILDELNGYARENELAPLSVELLLIKAQFELLQLNSNLCRSALEEARTLAVSEQLLYLLPRIEEKETAVQQELQKWKELSVEEQKAEQKAIMEQLDLESVIASLSKQSDIIALAKTSSISSTSRLLKLSWAPSRRL